MRGWIGLAVALGGCEVTRDLRPERFACDAGGLCLGGADGGPDSGVKTTSCPIATTCRCQAGQACELICNGSCNVECLSGSTCTVQCAAASCDTICEEGARCSIACSAGECTTLCEATSVCEIDCSLAQCECTGPACPF